MLRFHGKTRLHQGKTGGKPRTLENWWSDFPVTAPSSYVWSAPHAMDELLALLRKNARASLEDLARELALPEQEVARRIDHLEKEGVILGYQAVVDSQKRAAEVVTSVVEVRITPERGG